MESIIRIDFYRSIIMTIRRITQQEYTYRVREQHHNTGHS